MGNDGKKNDVFDMFGKALSKAGELGAEAGGAIKDFVESEKTKKVVDDVKKGASAAADTVVKGASVAADSVAKGASVAADSVVKGAKFAADGVVGGAQRAAEGIKIVAEENAKKKAEKRELRKEIRAELKAEKERIKNDRTEESNHDIINMKKSGIKLLIPDGYKEIKVDKTGDPKVDGAKEKFFLGKTVSYSGSVVIIFSTDAEAAMDFNGKQGVIDGIHECMSEQQGLICVEAGKTKRGYDYIYSIVKTLSDEMFGGVMYFIRMNIGYEGKIIEIQADFKEIGDTGMREAFSMEFARRAELLKPGSLEGWSEDPYDPNYKKGIPMNLSERAGLDCIFTEHPLAQAREFIQAVLFDELMEVKDDAEADKEEADSESKDDTAEGEETEKMSEKDMVLPLFDKGEECRRHTYHVRVKL